MNQRETIEGVEGEWRTVTKPSEVTVGQRVRYRNAKNGWSWDERADRFFGFINGQACSLLYTGAKAMELFNKDEIEVQAFFPIAKPAKRKVAKVKIDNFEYEAHAKVFIEEWVFNLNGGYANKRNALRGARRFCKAIGWEMEVVK